MNSLSENAVAKLLEGYNCAQSVLCASCDRLTLDKANDLLHITFAPCVQTVGMILEDLL